jgi:hypothetical protein
MTAASGIHRGCEQQNGRKKIFFYFHTVISVSESRQDNPKMEDQILLKILHMGDTDTMKKQLLTLNLSISKVLSWEDSSRQQNNSPENLTDLSLQVGKSGVPVIRHEKYMSRTCHLEVSKFMLLVGNSQSSDSATFKAITLSSFLENWQDFLTDKRSLDPSSSKSLLEGKSDSHLIVSAQACFLPLSQGRCEFYPIAYNYKSYFNCPGILSIIATRQGTSITISGREGDDHKLYFNENGKRTPFFIDTTATRHVVLFIQVPLKQPKFRNKDLIYRRGNTANVNPKMTDSFSECDSLKIERDTSQPIRVTVQFCYGTTNGDILPDMLTTIRDTLQNVYQGHDFISVVK